MFKIYGEPELPNRGGVSKICGIIYGEPESPNEGACLRCDEPQVLARLRLQMRGGPPPLSKAPLCFSERRTIKSAFWPCEILRLFFSQPVLGAHPPLYGWAAQAKIYGELFSPNEGL